MDNKVLFLKENGKYIEGNESDIKKYWNKSKFILIPITEYNIHGFIPVMPHELDIDLSKMEYAEIDVQMGYVYYDYDVDYEEIIKCKKTSFEINSIIEFINLMHSIDKISYFNDIFYSDYSDIISPGIIILYMHLNIFSHDRMIYNRIYRFNRDAQVSDESIIFTEYANIYKSFKEVYHGYYSIDKNLSTLVFNMYKHIWKNDKDTHSQITKNNIKLKYFEHECYGVYSTLTNTIYVMDSNTLHDIANIYNVNAEFYISSTVDVSEMIDIIDFFQYYNYYTINIHLVVSYIGYLSYGSAGETNTIYLMDETYDFDHSIKISYPHDVIDVDLMSDCLELLHKSYNEKDSDNNEEPFA